MHQDQGEVPPLKTKTQANNYVLFSQNGVKQIKDENTARERNEYWILTLTCMRAKKESYIFGVRRRRIVLQNGFYFNFAQIENRECFETYFLYFVSNNIKYLI